MSILLLSLLAVSALAGDCNNPIWQQQSALMQIVSFKLPLQSAPTPQTHFGSCKYLDGQPSCCNATTFAPVKEIFEEYSGYLDAFKEILPELSGEMVYQYAASYLNVTSLTATQKEAVDKLVSEVKRLFSKMIDCVGGLFGYIEGLFCLACDPNYAQYMAFNENITLSLAEDTCDSVYDTCVPFVGELKKAIIVIIKSLINLLSGIDQYQDLVEALQNYLHQFETESLCGDQGCKALVCNEALPALFNPSNASTYTSHLNTFSNVLSAATTHVNVEYTSSGFEAYSIGCANKLTSYDCPKMSGSGLSTGTWILIIGASIFAVAGVAFIFSAMKRRRRSEPLLTSSTDGYAQI